MTAWVFHAIHYLMEQLKFSDNIHDRVIIRIPLWILRLLKSFTKWLFMVVSEKQATACAFVQSEYILCRESIMYKWLLILMLNWFFADLYWIKCHLLTVLMQYIVTKKHVLCVGLNSTTSGPSVTLYWLN